MGRSLLVILFGACATTGYYYTPSSTRAIPPRPDGCPFEVLSMPPTRAFEELGVFELRAGVDPAPTNVADFRGLVAIHVCRGGGDAVVAYPNGRGQYLQGTLIRYAAAPAS